MNNHEFGEVKPGYHWYHLINSPNHDVISHLLLLFSYKKKKSDKVCLNGMQKLLPTYEMVKLADIHNCQVMVFLK